MADPVVFRNGYFAVASSTSSNTYNVFVGVKSVQMPLSRAELDNAAMGDDIDGKYPGIFSAPVTVTYRQDFSTGAAPLAVDKNLWTYFTNRTALKIKARAVNSGVTNVNPSYKEDRVYIFGITPIVGSHGQILENKVEFRPASGCTLTRSTST